MAKKSWIVKSQKDPKFSVRHNNRCHALRPQPGIYAEVRRLPNLLPRAGLIRQAPRRDKVELVGTIHSQ